MITTPVGGVPEFIVPGETGALVAPRDPAARPADVASALIHEEPGYQLMTNPAWQCEALTRVTVEWLNALA